ncbi:MAG TPA: hypothetical protein VHG10_12810 [Glycomyces sp.]|nr:hypothetical protein [Glycomyces sp.]
MSFAAVVRPVIDRIHVSLRLVSRESAKALYASRGLQPGLELDMFYALLDHPVPEAAAAARMTYLDFDPAGEADRGVVELSGGAWHLTGTGRELALALDAVFGETAERLWSYRPSSAMSGLEAAEAAAELIGRVLAAGQATGGPAFVGLTPVWEAPGAGPAQRLVPRLEALRHHRADAHRAAWRAEGLTVEAIQTMAPGPQRDAIEDETNRRDEPIYACLSDAERLQLLGALGALPDGLQDR